MTKSNPCTPPPPPAGGARVLIRRGVPLQTICNLWGIESEGVLISQVASGMAHLERKGLIHRDLAARNVLIGNNNHAAQVE